ncbi:NB-ARC domain-containing protein [Saccharopolyspora indica]|uniref:NB-ARC domain-containing protein n=1 Tax=Saccharopolyspora indica TaxID=1229659 RepID=UPI0022EAFB30|nr:NB-ARC domain-containing protein [Saccharopolyspora indica]MDA3644811.1 NB-ARC domain-containing protein [Saccharopolyspora indica]
MDSLTGDRMGVGMQESAHNALNGHVGSAVQARYIHGDVNFNGAPAVGPGLGTVTPPVAAHDVRGRDELVRSVVEALRGRNPVVLHGAGGYGKTTVAQCVVTELGVETWWVDASSEASLHDGLREVALRAGADPEEVQSAWEGRGLAPDLLWRQLEQRTDWLLVLDNADDSSLLGAGRPVSAGTGWLRRTGSVLVTSRDGHPQAWGNLAQLHAVGLLSSAAGAQVLLDRAPTAGTPEQARELAERLGGLPLALHLAGQYLSVSGAMPRVPGLELPTDFTGYRTALDERWPEVTELPEAPHPLTQRAMLHRTWELSLDLLAERGHPMARPLIHLLAQFEAAPIPLELLDVAVLVVIPEFEGLTALRLAATLSALSGFGLIESTTHGEAAIPVLRLHPVIREANRYQVSDDKRDTYVLVCLGLLTIAGRSIDAGDYTTWPLWSLLVPHCAFLASFADQRDEFRELVGGPVADMCTATGASVRRWVTSPRPSAFSSWR